MRIARGMIHARGAKFIKRCTSYVMAKIGEIVHLVEKTDNTSDHSNLKMTMIHIAGQLWMCMIA